MPILLSAQNLKKIYGARPLFEGLSLVVETGDRIGLIGPNGAGKSTLLRILASEIGPDEGTLSFTRGTKVAYLSQSPELRLDATVRETVMEGAGSEDDSDALATAQEIMAHLCLGDLSETPVKTLSGGWKKRVALARELSRRPDLLLLDEPTNHLDVESILWLEDWMARSRVATLTITHDRLFLQRIANRIVELDTRNPGGLLDVRGDYATYLDQKAENMAAQAKQEESLKNKLRRETEWLRRGAKARTTKQQARIGRAESLQEEVKELGFRNQSRSARLDFADVDYAPKRLIEAKGISKSYGGRKVFTNQDLWIGPGSRIGLLGPNGCGKSTLLKVLLGVEPPDKGEVFRSDSLKVAYFEQTRDALDPDATVSGALNSRGDHVNYRGRFLHVRSYLDRFLFRPEQMEMRVGRLSGGEQSRLRIAQLMLNESNILVLDEPTNDLDIATLDVLEDCLVDFNGAVLLVTHDRYFLDQVATTILAFDPRPDHSGHLTAFAGVSQWENWHSSLDEKPRKETPSATAASTPTSENGAKRKKLSFKEQREWDGMEASIEKTEARLAELNEALNSPDNASSASKLTDLYAQLGQTQTELDRLYARWAELETIVKG